MLNDPGRLASGRVVQELADGRLLIARKTGRSPAPALAAGAMLLAISIWLVCEAVRSGRDVGTGASTVGLTVLLAVLGGASIAGAFASGGTGED
jgi:hypothetical protein